MMFFFFFFFFGVVQLSRRLDFFCSTSNWTGQGGYVYYAHEKHLVRAKQGPDVLQSVQCRLVSPTALAALPARNARLGASPPSETGSWGLRRLQNWANPICFIFYLGEGWGRTSKNLKH